MPKVNLPQLANTSVFLYPTDTIWGIGALATVAQNYDRIKSIKQRPSQMNFVLLMKDLAMIERYATDLDPKWKKWMLTAQEPTTFLLPKVDLLPEDCQPIGSDLTAVRISTHPVCVALMDYYDAPIISTSANIHKQLSATDLKSVDPSILQSVDYVLGEELADLGTGKPSTIVGLDDKNNPVRYR